MNAAQAIASPPNSPLTESVREYQSEPGWRPLLLQGDALSVLADLPSETVDMCITSPPYWGHREYAGAGIGLENTASEYVRALSAICSQVCRVLKPTGSFWLNIGDSYDKKCLQGVPWRVAFALIDSQGWTLRNDVIWNKVKGGPDNAADKLRNIHEHIFHFVKKPTGYYYNTDSIRNPPGKSKVVNGSIVSATGVSGVRYKRQIELSTVLSDSEKKAAFTALNELLADVSNGKLSDFRMIIRGQQRATHSDSSRVSGRARELEDRGFYFLRYDPRGSKPSDVWDILPEDTQRSDAHFAPFPEDLCRIPILATCPPDGLMLDPFCGTGTALAVAHALGRKSIGIDISEDYIRAARGRFDLLL